MINMGKKKGVSPTIATVLLVVIVIIIGIVVFQWFRGFIKEAIEKNGENVDLTCNDVSFKADYSSGILSIVNLGNIPIYSMSLKIIRDGSYETKEVKEISEEWPEKGLTTGSSFFGSIAFDGATKIALTPILLGKSKSGYKIKDCPEDKGGEVIVQ